MLGKHPVILAQCRSTWDSERRSVELQANEAVCGAKLDISDADILTIGSTVDKFDDDLFSSILLNLDDCVDSLIKGLTASIANS